MDKYLPKAENVWSRRKFGFLSDLVGYELRLCSIENWENIFRVVLEYAHAPLTKHQLIVVLHENVLRGQLKENNLLLMKSI